MHTVDVQNLTHKYGDRTALDQVTFSVEPGEVFGFLGPNGGGKTTLFKLLSTAMSKNQGGTISINGVDPEQNPNKVREQLGVVFQSPSLDKKLSVYANLKYQGNLYGLSGADLKARIDQQLERLRLSDRKNDIVETLSGGLKRRVEIAKSLLHNPKLLLLDEPTTGLDPGVRLDVWEILMSLRDRQKMTCLVTTHLIEEAEKCDRVCILNEGKIVALDTPANLKAEIKGEIITITTQDRDTLKDAVFKKFDVSAQVMADKLRIQTSNAEALLPRIKEAFNDEIDSISIARPTLNDVFILKTGHEFWRQSN